ncbi:inositol monophosphatase family protein [Amycolatopsis sp. NPDC051102]|uniref:inositol monophosphatase family protein n=1 Tax=Amycolatopsis sp. NPDC051102 TaxID=3155163 RepID=UPI003427D2F6
MTALTSDAELLTIAVSAARRGVAAIRERLLPTLLPHHKQPTDVLTEADLASDRAITSYLRGHRPHDALLSEEQAIRDPIGRGGYRWLIDPLDGSVNYANAIPHYCVSVAAQRHDDNAWHTVVAAVLDVVRREEFTAALGHGAHLNGRLITPSTTNVMAAALVATEYSYDRAHRAHQIQQLAFLLGQARDVRSTGSSALDLCWTACGRLDAFVEDDLELWDWAAAALVVTEAGGHATPVGSGVAASGNALHPALLECLSR